MTTAEEKEILSLLCKVHELEIDKVGCQFGKYFQTQIYQRWAANIFKLKYIKGELPICQIFSHSNILKLVCRQIS